MDNVLNLHFSYQSFINWTYFSEPYSCIVDTRRICQESNRFPKIMYFLHGEQMTRTILGLGGSPRSGSTTAMALRLALDGASQAGARTGLIDLATVRLPLFDGTYTLDGYTPTERKTVTTLFDAVDEAQGIILASPVYHNSISGSLKNALDFLELLYDTHASGLRGKVVGIIAAQGGSSGSGMNTLTTMLLAARAMGAWVAPTMVTFRESRQEFDEAGHVRNPALDQRLRQLGSEVARASDMFAEHWVAEEHYQRAFHPALMNE
jgi:FMN reductase